MEKNNRFKFRAWDKVQKKMVTNFMLGPTSPTWSPHIIRGSEKPDLDSLLDDYFHQEIIGGNYTVTDWSDFYGIDNLIVLQWTGLFDKKGVEIFEGDLVKMIDEVCKIIYNNCTASFDFMYAGGDCESLEDIEDIEVIGNIFENPELL